MTYASRRTFLAAAVGAMALGGLGACASQALRATPQAASGKRRKFLFVAVDDLRPMMGHYGDTSVMTPNFDAFAMQSLSFDNAYTHVATCGASRAALFTALRPETTGMITARERIDESAAGRAHLHTSFRNAGFTTIGMGKVLHYPDDAPEGWSKPSLRIGAVRASGIPDEMPTNDSALDPASVEIWEADPYRNREGGKRRQPVTEAADVADGAYKDGQLAELGIDRLRQFAASDEDFFLALGFQKPHLPFNAPKKYWDLYDRDRIALTPRPRPAEGAPPYAVTTAGEVQNYSGLPPFGDGWNEEQTRLLTHGYMACVSYIDAQFGRVIEAVREAGLWDELVICLWGDHGFKLGDYNSWTKHTNYEIDTRVPLMLRAPGLTTGGERCDALVETVDIFPTLLDLASLPVPDDLEGISFAPLLADPNKPWKSAAFSQFGRNVSGGALMGYAVRTRDFRYVVWKERESGKRVAEELYDRRSDPLETRNVADLPRYAEELARLRTLRDTGWKAALPQPTGA